MSTVRLLSLAALLLIAPPVVAAPEDPSGMGALSYYRAAILATTLAACHVLAPRIRRLLAGRETIVASLGGGMAVAYVFFHLIPELDEGHALLGRVIFAAPLLGFLLQYLVKSRVVRLEKRSGFSLGFVPKLANLCWYNWLIVYGSPAERPESDWHAIPMFVAIVLHLVHADYALGSEEPKRFDSIGRWCLALASLLGYVAIVVGQRTIESLDQILMAFLAGSILYNVFSDEVPDERKVRFEWFFLGTLGFALMVLLS